MDDNAKTRDELIGELDAARRQLAALQAAGSRPTPSTGNAWDRVMFEHAPDPMFLVDPEHATVAWMIVDCNAAACQLNGYTRDELLGQSISLLSPETCDPDGLIDMLERLTAGATLTRHVSYRHRNGTLIPIELSATQIRVEARSLILGIGRSLAARSQAETMLRASRDQLAVILQGAAEGIVVHDATGRMLYANDAAARIIGFPSPQALLETPPRETMRMFHVEDEFGRQIPQGHLPGRRALEGESSPEQLLRYRALATGEDRWVIVKATAIFNQQGDVALAINIFHDVTREKQREANLRFLAETSTALALTLNYEITLQNIARLAVPTLADWCVVDEIAPDGTLQRLAVAHVDPSKEELLWQLQRHYPLDRDGTSGTPKVLRTGVPELYAEIPAAFVKNIARDAEHLTMLRTLGSRSAMIVPLIARGEILAAISFGTAESRRSYDRSDLVLAEDLAQRAALAMDNARLYRASQEAFTRKEESRALLDTLLATVPVGFALVDHEMRFAQVNLALATISGLPPEDHIGRTPSQVLPVLGPIMEPVLRRTFEAREPIIDLEMTGKATAAPGAARHYLTSYYPVWDGSGILLGVGACVLDITARKHVEQELRVRARQQAVVASLGQSALGSINVNTLSNTAVTMVAQTLEFEQCAIWRWSPDDDQLVLETGVGWSADKVGKLTIRVNRDSLAGYTLLAREPVAIGSFHDQSPVTGLLLDHLNEVTGGIGVIIQGTPQAYRILAVQTTRTCQITRDDVNFVQAVAHIISTAIEHNEAEEARSLYQAIVDSSDDAIISTNLDGVIISWNPGAAHLYGYLAHEAIGQLVAMLLPHDLQDEVPVIINRIKETMCTQHVETVRVRKDGQHIDVALTFSPIKDATGSLTGISGISRDMTERKRIAAERAVAEALQHTDRLKSEFIANVSHELRTPLHHIKGYVSTLRRRWQDLDSETMQDSLQIIEDDSNRLTRLIDDLLNTSQIESGTLRLSIDTLPVDDLVRSAVQRWQGTEGHNFEAIIPANVPPVPADPYRIQQVLDNLLGNVVRYTPEGTLTTIRITVKREHVLVSIRDRGPGIPTEHLPYLFERFYQAGHTSQSRRGNGLGLFISKSIVEQHGGNMGVELPPDHGARFWFSLPRRHSFQAGIVPEAAS
jgi:PAS domain S-box-containing protein